MFCKFGSDDERRPVAATVWLKLVWTRWVRGSTSNGRASAEVPFSLLNFLNSRIFATTGCWSRRPSSTLASVEYPLFVLRPPGGLRSSKRHLASACAELTLIGPC